MSSNANTTDGTAASQGSPSDKPLSVEVHGRHYPTRERLAEINKSKGPTGSYNGYPSVDYPRSSLRYDEIRTPPFTEVSKDGTMTNRPAGSEPANTTASKP